METEVYATGRMVIRSEPKLFDQVRKRLAAYFDKYQYTEDQKFSIWLAVTEALSNACLHGNQSVAEKPITIQYNVAISATTISVTDRGHGFNWRQKTEPDFESEHGRGRFLIEQFTEGNIRYNERGNEITMTWVRE